MSSNPPPLRWALAGASDIAATRVIPAMRALGHKVVAIYSGDPDHGARFAAVQGIGHLAPSLDQLVGCEVDAVYVSSRNELHADQALAAAAADKHVLCEKPLALDITEARTVVASCRDAGVVLATNHHLRNGATIRAIARLVADGAIGQPLAVRVHHAVALPERLYGWRLDRSNKGSGVIFDITVHDADTLRFVIGDEIADVMSMSAIQGLADGTEDAAMNLLRFSSGLLATTHEAFTVPHAGTGFEVHGTEGSLVGRDVLTQDPVGEVWLRHGSAAEPVDAGPREDLYVYGLRRFATAVAGDGLPAATGEDGLRSLAVAVAARKSAATGHRVAVHYGGTANAMDESAAEVEAGR